MPHPQRHSKPGWMWPSLQRGLLNIDIHSKYIFLVSRFYMFKYWYNFLLMIRDLLCKTAAEWTSVKIQKILYNTFSFFRYTQALKLEVINQEICM